MAFLADQGFRYSEMATKIWEDFSNSVAVWDYLNFNMFMSVENVLNKFNEFQSKMSKFDLVITFKVQLFWEGHKNLPNCPYLLNKRQNHKHDCANFCGILRKAELYNQ